MPALVDFSDVQELALRAAVKKSIAPTSDSKSGLEIMKSALKSSSPSEDSATGRHGDTNALVGVAVAVLATGYAILERQHTLAEMDVEYLAKELDAGIATMVIPSSKLNRSKEVKAIEDLLRMAKDFDLSLEDLGIKESKIGDDSFYSVLPYYKMVGRGSSDDRVHPTNLEAARTNIGLVLAVDAVTPLKKGEDKILHQRGILNKMGAPFERLYERNNYLNDIRAPRLILMSVANLLWNLQHPVNKEGMPLSLEESIELCEKASQFLNKLGSPAYSPFIEKLPAAPEFIQRTQASLALLKRGYEHEQETSVKLNDVTDAAHSGIRCLYENLFGLVYPSKDAHTKKTLPDSMAEKTVANHLANIDTYISLDPGILANLNKALSPKTTTLLTRVPAAAGMHTPIQSTMDILILLCHLSKDDFVKLMNKCDAQPGHGQNHKLFLEEMRKFHEHFVSPVQKKFKGIKLPDEKEFSTVQRAARRLIPFLSSVNGDIKHFKSPGESESIGPVAAKKRHESMKKIHENLDTQLESSAAESSKDSYYRWDILTVDGKVKPSEARDILRDLPKYGYRMSQMTKLIDNIEFMSQNYATCLTDETYVKFMVECLSKFKAETKALNDKIDKMTQTFRDPAQSRDATTGVLVNVLEPMSAEFKKQVAAVNAASSRISLLLQRDTFIPEQQAFVKQRFGEIGKQYEALFGSSPLLAGVEAKLLGSAPSAEPAVAAAPPTALRAEEGGEPSRPKRAGAIIKRPQGTDEVAHVMDVPDTSNEKRELIKLIDSCFDAMSYQSRHGEKGDLLKLLKQRIEVSGPLSKEDVGDMVKHLVSITARYRETYFFQASYGETRSAKALLAAVRDPVINETLGLSKLILGDKDAKIKDIKDDVLIGGLVKLRETTADKTKFKDFSEIKQGLIDMKRDNKDDSAPKMRR